MCKCKEGFVGDGFTCVEINPCEQKNRGGCHIQVGHTSRYLTRSPA